VLSALQSLPISETNRREVKRFVKFAMVGAAGMITHLTLANIFNFGLHFPDALANAIGFVVAVVQNYFLNYRWTFGDRRYTTTKSRWLQVSQFAIVSIVGLGINAIVREIVSYFMHPIWLSLLPDPMVAEVINYNFSIAAAIGVVLFWNFAINRLWTFRNS
jgi:putative flippase GtrA